MSRRPRLRQPEKCRKADGKRCSTRQYSGSRCRCSSSSGRRASRDTNSRPGGCEPCSRSSGRDAGHRSGEAACGRNLCSHGHADVVGGSRRAEAAACRGGHQDADCCQRCLQGGRRLHEQPHLSEAGSSRKRIFLTQWRCGQKMFRCSHQGILPSLQTMKPQAGALWSGVRR